MQKKKTTLLVDDEVDQLELIGTAVRRAGHDVLESSSWLEALALAQLRVEPVDIIVPDLVMPDSSSVGILKELRNELGRIPVIVLSGHRGAIRLLTGVLDGVVQWLYKPVEARTLVDAIRCAIGDPN